MLLYVLAIAMALWVILPIYFITLGAFSTQDAVYTYPRELLPHHLSTDTLSFFLHSSGIIDALERSVQVAAITLVISLAIGVPAGYALARFAFRGADAFRLTIVSTRAFPIVILAIPLVGHVHPLGHRRLRARRRDRAHRARAAVRRARRRRASSPGISDELEEAAMTLGCSRAHGVARRSLLPLALPGLAAAAIFVFIISWNEVFAASMLTLGTARCRRRC